MNQLNYWASSFCSSAFVSSKEHIMTMSTGFDLSEEGTTCLTALVTVNCTPKCHEDHVTTVMETNTTNHMHCIFASSA